MSQAGSIELVTGFVRNSLPNEPSHLFYHKSGGFALRSVCGAVEMLSDCLFPSSNVECHVCLGDTVEDNEVKMSGHEPELTVEEFKTIWNRCVNEGEKLEYYLPAVKDQTPEALVDHIGKLTKLTASLKIMKQASKATLDAKRIHLAAPQKEALRLREMQYKPKPVAASSKAAKPKGPATTTKEGAIQSMMKNLGWSREKAEKFFNKTEAEEGAQ